MNKSAKHITPRARGGGAAGLDAGQRSWVMLGSGAVLLGRHGTSRCRGFGGTAAVHRLVTRLGLESPAGAGRAGRQRYPL